VIVHLHLPVAFQRPPPCCKSPNHHLVRHPCQPLPVFQVCTAPSTAMPARKRLPSSAASSTTSGSDQVSLQLEFNARPSAETSVAQHVESGVQLACTRLNHSSWRLPHEPGWGQHNLCHPRPCGQIAASLGMGDVDHNTAALAHGWHLDFQHRCW